MILSIVNKKQEKSDRFFNRQSYSEHTKYDGGAGSAGPCRQGIHPGSRDGNHCRVHGDAGPINRLPGNRCSRPHLHRSSSRLCPCHEMKSAKRSSARLWKRAWLHETRGNRPVRMQSSNSAVSVEAAKPSRERPTLGRYAHVLSRNSRESTARHFPSRKRSAVFSTPSP